MSLELLREKFGHSGVSKEADNKEKIHEKLSTRFIYEKEADNREKIHEKLNTQFNARGDFKSIKVQHQEQLDEKQRIIESLEIQIDNLNESKRMEDKINLTTKQIYEDKIKKMSYVDSTELIPLLLSVSRKKQGNKRLDWSNWLKIAENKYLFQINESLAKKVFEDTNILVDRAIGSMYRQRTRGGDVAKFSNNNSIQFTRVGVKDHIKTDFNPDDYNLNLGCTVSYWVRPDEVGNTMFALGRKHSGTQRFVFGINRKRQGYFALGSNKLTTSWVNMDTPVEEELLEESGEYWNLKTDGTWYHFVVTYDDRADTSSGADRKVYVNGVLRHTNSINWSDTGGSTGGMYFGCRNINEDFDNGWACGLDEVSIFNTAKDATWVSNAYNSGNPTDLQSESGLVGYWKFNEGSGNTIKDYSGNDNHGTFGAISGDTTEYPIWSTDTP